MIVKLTHKHFWYHGTIYLNQMRISSCFIIMKVYFWKCVMYPLNNPDDGQHMYMQVMGIEGTSLLFM